MTSELQILDLDCHRPRQCGREHGETLRRQIRELADIRWTFLRKDAGFTSNQEINDLAKAHLPLLKNFDEPLYEELLGIAEGASISPEKVVVLNHYTDMRDLAPGKWQDEGGCSAVYVSTDHGPILGQTWDIHGNATDYITMLRIKHGQEQCIVFSIAGCLGLAGLSSRGVSVTINNLSSIDARLGVVWPAVVRKILMQPTAKAGVDMLLSAPLGSGHHYNIADEKDFFGVDSSGTKKKVTQDGVGKSHFHTNHCVDEEMAQTHRIRPGSTTLARYDTLKVLLPERLPKTAPELFEMLGDVSAPRKMLFPRKVATCGAIVMDINQRKVYACKGPPSKKFGNAPQLIEFR